MRIEFTCQCTDAACGCGHGWNECKNVATRELSTNENQSFCIVCEVSQLTQHPELSANEFRDIPPAAYDESRSEKNV